MNLKETELLLLQFINHPISPVINLFFVFLSYSIYGCIFLLAYHYYRKKERTKLIHFFVTLIIGFLFVAALKFLIGRPRPYLAHPEIIKNVLYIQTMFGADPSFPSRHAFLSFLLIRFLPKGMPRMYFSLSVVYLVSILFAAMYNGVHYPSDLLAGAFLGFLFPTLLPEKLSIKIFDKLIKKI